MTMLRTTLLLSTLVVSLTASFLNSVEHCASVFAKLEVFFI